MPEKCAVADADIGSSSPKEATHIQKQSVESDSHSQVHVNSSQDEVSWYSPRRTCLSREPAALPPVPHLSLASDADTVGQCEGQQITVDCAATHSESAEIDQLTAQLTAISTLDAANIPPALVLSANTPLPAAAAAAVASAAPTEVSASTTVAPSAEEDLQQAVRQQGQGKASGSLGLYHTAPAAMTVPELLSVHLAGVDLLTHHADSLQAANGNPASASATDASAPDAAAATERFVLANSAAVTDNAAATILYTPTDQSNEVTGPATGAPNPAVADVLPGVNTCSGQNNQATVPAGGTFSTAAAACSDDGIDNAGDFTQLHPDQSVTSNPHHSGRASSETVMHDIHSSCALSAVAAPVVAVSLTPEQAADSPHVDSNHAVAGLPAQELL